MRDVRCADCGFEARGIDQDSLADQVRSHAWDAHRMALTHDEALLLAFHAQLGALPTTRRHGTTHKYAPCRRFRGVT